VVSPKRRVPHAATPGAIERPAGEDCKAGAVCRLWQALCPRTAYRASKLYLPPGAKRFASRRAFRLGYTSERGGSIDRSHHRQSRIYERLGETYRCYEQAPPKRPKGMHHRTYERLVAKLFAAMDAHEIIFNTGAARILANDPTLAKRLHGRF
jgi:hypothetical protein